MRKVFALTLLACGNASSDTFHACVRNIASSVIDLCGSDLTNPRCDSKCASAIKQLAPKLDGSCCTELPGEDQPRCVAQIKHRGETLVPRYEALCPGFEVDFVESVLGRLPLAFEETDKTFHACVRNKASSVLDLCGSDLTNPRCDSKCASAIKQLAPKLDGSCCTELPGKDQPRCVAQIKHRGETLVRRYEALCPGFEETDKTFHACIRNKASSVLDLCGSDLTNPRCDSKCASAIKQLAPKLDGSCCTELPGEDQPRCVAQIKHRGETLVSRYEALCPGLDFVESVLGSLPLAFEETGKPAVTFVETSSISVWQAAACASVAGAVGAAAALTVVRLVGRRQEVLLAN